MQALESRYCIQSTWLNSFKPAIVISLHFYSSPRHGVSSDSPPPSRGGNPARAAALTSSVRGPAPDTTSRPPSDREARRRHSGRKYAQHRRDHGHARVQPAPSVARGSPVFRPSPGTRAPGRYVPPTATQAREPASRLPVPAGPAATPRPGWRPCAARNSRRRTAGAASQFSPSLSPPRPDQRWCRG